MKVLIACGGTGGHFFPGLAVAETLVAGGHKVRLLVSEKTVDQTAAEGLLGSFGRARVEVQTVPAVGYNGSRQLIRFCCRLARATRDCAAVCEDFGPDAVLGMGGYTSAPAVLAARWPDGRRRRPSTLIHESNAVPGKANRWVGRFVDHVAVGLAECVRFFDGRPVTVTGTPIRSGLRAGTADGAHDRLGLERGRLTVLVMGGSQGARALNEGMACALPWLERWKDETQFVHLSGQQDEELVRDAYDKNECVAKVMSFCSEMNLAYSAADLVIARAGAATLTELAAFGLPSVLVPYPQAAGNHQWHNARVFERTGAARLLDQSQFDHGLHAARGERLAEVVAGLLADESRRARMAAAARALAVEDASERIVALLEQYAN